MPSRFVYSYAGVGEYMRTDRDLSDALRERADLAVAFAKSIAPVGTPPGDEHPGRYRDSLDVRGPVMFTDRAGWEIGSSEPYATAVEAHHHTMGAAVAAFSHPRGGPGL